MNPLYFITGKEFGGPQWSVNQFNDFIKYTTQNWISVVLLIKNGNELYDREMWCQDNCSSYMTRELNGASNSINFYFKEPIDAIAFKLRWL